MSIFPDKKIGIIWDKHSSHYSEEVLEFIERCNSDKLTHTRIVHELVDEGLTPIIQVPDVAVKKVFKSTVKKKYHHYRSGLAVNIGQKVSVSREKVVEFVLDAIREINDNNNEHQFITDAFKRCGLNPWSQNKSLEAFQQHLDKLESNDVLRAMLLNQNALDLIQ